MDNRGRVVEDLGNRVRVYIENPTTGRHITKIFPKSQATLLSGHSPPLGGNGKPRDGAEAGSGYLDDREAARWVWRAARGGEILEAKAKRLHPEWGDAALLAEQDG